MLLLVSGLKNETFKYHLFITSVKMAKYTIAKEGTNIKIKEMERGKVRFMTFEEYVTSISDKKQDIFPLFEDYFKKDEKAIGELRFEEEGNKINVMYDTIILQALKQSQLREYINNDEEFLGVKYSEILYNTKERLNTETKKFNLELSEILKDKQFIKKHKGLTYVLAGAVLATGVGLGSWFGNSMDYEEKLSKEETKQIKNEFIQSLEYGIKMMKDIKTEEEAKISVRIIKEEIKYLKEQELNKKDKIKLEQLVKELEEKYNIKIEEDKNEKY